MKKISTYLLFILELMLLMICPSQIKAAGISVTPSNLNYYLPIGQQTVKYLTVKNFSAAPQLYNLYSDEFSDIITLEPKIFRLDPTEQLRVAVTVRPDKPGTLVTYLSVVAEEIDRRQFNAATGVKIPLQITAVSASSFIQNNFFWLVLIVGLLIILIDVIIISRRRKKLTLVQRIKQSFNKLKQKIKQRHI